MPCDFGHDALTTWLTLKETLYLVSLFHQHKLDFAIYRKIGECGGKQQNNQSK
jgi:hypothetical protein